MVPMIALSARSRYPCCAHNNIYASNNSSLRDSQKKKDTSAEPSELHFIARMKQNKHVAGMRCLDIVQALHETMTCALIASERRVMHD